MRHWLALAKAPRVASQKHPILVLDGPSHDLHISQHVPVASALSCFLANTALPLLRLPASRQLVALVTASFPCATVHAPVLAPVCPLCVWRVPPLCVPPLAPSAGTPASPPLMTSDDYQMTSGTLAGSAAFRCTFAGTAATAGATEGVSVGAVGACRPRCGFVTGKAAAAAGAGRAATPPAATAWHASTHCESI